MRHTKAGYAALVEHFNLKVIPHFRESFIKDHGQTESSVKLNQELFEYAPSYALDNANDVCEQMSFALKYDGINLEILHAIFQQVDPIELQTYIAKTPTGKYSRILWFLYEFLNETKLEIPDLKGIKYIDVLDPKLYFTASSIKSSRHAVNNNLLGNTSFCPMVRRTDSILQCINQHYEQQAKDILENFSPYVLERAANYLYAKETISSFQIEKEQPSQQRAARFIQLLKNANTEKDLTKELLIDYQKIIIEPRFIESDYRHTQNYVGENLNYYIQKIHYISPKPKSVEKLMQGLLEALKRMKASNVHPVIVAASISFGFVFIHPFEDGNGRLHRFIIHKILAKQGFTPLNAILPISATMLNNMRAYDAVLESFSRPLLDCITQYILDSEGILTVNEDTENYYKYIDYTHITEYLFECIGVTITEHFKNELEYIVQYDKTKQGLQNIVDMPDKLIDLFIRCIVQNNGKLAKQKRSKYFSVLTEQELSEMTQCVNTYMLLPK